MVLKRPEHPMRVATVVAVVLIAVNVAIWGAHAQKDGPAAPQRPVEIVQLFPEESGHIIPQSTVGAQLIPKFTGQLTVDDKLIPKDETTGDPGLGLVLFEPKPGKTFTEFGPGVHRALIEWWPRTFSTPEDAKTEHQLRSYPWAFSVG